MRNERENANNTRFLLQTTEGKDKMYIAFMRKS